MKEIRTYIFTLIKDDATFRALTGATVSDPRIFWQFPPKKISMSGTTPGYLVYYRSGTARPGIKVDIAGRNDQIYTVEVMGQTPDLCDDIGDRLVDMFRDGQFTTDNYSILYTDAQIIGSPILDEARRAYMLNVNLYIMKIVAK